MDLRNSDAAAEADEISRATHLFLLFCAVLFGAFLLWAYIGKLDIVSIAVGDAVSKGQPVIVLESMKMENTITSPVDGTVSAVHVAAGDSVQHGQTLAEIAQA